MRILIVVGVICFSCNSTKKIYVPHRHSSLTGSEFYHQAFAMNWKERDSFVVKEVLAGNIPSFLTKFEKIKVSILDSSRGKTISAEYFVSPDYLSIGTDDDWARINITPLAAQRTKGLIAGIQKDVVISGKISRDPKPDRVAIYGWHKLDGNPIQPLYTGHIYWWVDYSQAIRLVYRKIKVGKKWMDYTEVLNDPVLKRLLCDEEWCDFYRYSY